MRSRTVWLAGLVLAVAAVGCATGFQRYKMKPPLADYDAALRAPGLRGEVHIYRDQYAVPHIFADHEYDLFFAIGWVQAQDRLWQMVLLRAIGQGRTAELLGRVSVPGANFKGLPIDTIKIDEMMRTFGMKFLGEVGAALVKERRPDIYLQLQAYCDGINYWLENHQEWSQLPVEFQLLKVKPEPWLVADALTMERLMGFMLTYSWQFELFRWGLLQKYGEEVMWEAAPLHDAYGPTIVPPELLKNRLASPRPLPPGGRPPREEYDYALEPGQAGLSGDAALTMLAAYDGFRKLIGQDLPFASNKWALSPKMTATGTAMLANDTHLPHIQPSFWYLCRVQGAGFNSFGVMLPGVPFNTLGHTPRLAWAATTSIADVQDLYLERVDEARPGHYFHDGEWKPFTTRQEIIKVRVPPFSNFFINRELTVRQTIHGPVISDYVPLPPDTPPVTMRWTAWDFSRNLAVYEALVTSSTLGEFMDKTRSMSDGEFGLMSASIALSMLMRAESVDDFIEAMDYIVLPSQNWTAADADGNIAYVPGGLVPIRKRGLGLMPVPGDGEWDWTGFIPLLELPHLINPERGWIVSANNEAVDLEWYPYVFSTNYDSGWRAMRVQELIEELAPIDMDDMKRIQNDVHATKARTEVPQILAACEKKAKNDPRAIKGCELLAAWDFETDLNSIATPVFFKWAEEMRRNVFAGHMDKEDFDLFLKGSNGDIPVEIIMKKGGSPLVPDLDEVIVKSVSDAVAFLEKKYGKDPQGWRWGDLHPIKFFHPLGVWPFNDLSVGPWPLPGSRHTLRCASPAEDGRWHFKAGFGPAWRFLIDLGDVEQALGVIDGSISGQYLSPHYRDLHEVWVAGEYLTLTTDPAKVKAEARYHMVLRP